MHPQEVFTSVFNEITAARNSVLPWFENPLQLREWLPLHGRWSIDEILHHITLTNHYLLILIDKATAKCINAKMRGEPLDWPLDYSLIPKTLAQAGNLNSFTWHRPDHMDPRLHPAKEDVRTLFLSQMDCCVSNLEKLEGGWGIACKTTMSVNDLGKLDVYQYLVFLCRHAERHCQQMAGNVESFGSTQ